MSDGWVPVCMRCGVPVNTLPRRVEQSGRVVGTMHNDCWWRGESERLSGQVAALRDASGRVVDETPHVVIYDGGRDRIACWCCDAGDGEHFDSCAWEGLRAVLAAADGAAQEGE